MKPKIQVSELEKFLIPNSYELKYDEETIVATILDEELDPIELSFHYDGCVEINTEGMKYITLSVQHLLNLIALINKSEEMYDKEEEKLSQN